MPRFAFTIFIFMLLVLLTLHIFYSRTNKQVHAIDKEANEQLSVYMKETADGSQQIRAFGWEASVLQRGLSVLDNSQKSFYYMDYKECWLGLLLDCCVLAISVTLVCLATDYGPMISAAVGPALIVTSQAAGVLQHFLQHCANLDTSLESFSELHSFIQETAQEDSGYANSTAVPEDWPHTGEIEFSNVNSEYITQAGSHVGVRNFSIGIDGGTKVGIPRPIGKWQDFSSFDTAQSFTLHWRNYHRRYRDLDSASTYFAIAHHINFAGSFAITLLSPRQYYARGYRQTLGGPHG